MVEEMWSAAKLTGDDPPPPTTLSQALETITQAPDKQGRQKHVRVGVGVTHTAVFN